MAKDGWSRAIVVGPVRCNFVQVTPDKAENLKNQKGEDYQKFSMQCLFPTECKQITNQLAAACKEALEARYGSANKAPSNLKKPILPGKKKDTEKYPFYKSMWYFSTTSYEPVPIIDASGHVGLGEAPPPDGTYARVKVVAKTYNPEKSQPGVSFRIEAVQPLPTATAQAMVEDMGYTEILDDSPLGGSRGPADEGFGAYDDGSTRPEDYTEPDAEEDGMDFMGEDDEDDDDVPF